MLLGLLFWKRGQTFCLCFCPRQNIPIISQNRFLEKKGELQEMSKGGTLFNMRAKFTPVHLFLFNDLLVIAAKKGWGINLASMFEVISTFSDTSIKLLNTYYKKHKQIVLDFEGWVLYAKQTLIQSSHIATRVIEMLKQLLENNWWNVNYSVSWGYSPALQVLFMLCTVLYIHIYKFWFIINLVQLDIIYWRCRNETTTSFPGNSPAVSFYRLLLCHFNNDECEYSPQTGSEMTPSFLKCSRK